MHFFSLFVTFATLASAGPLARRQTFSTTSYDDLSISGGVAGNAAQEALEKLGGLRPSTIGTLTEDDIDFLGSVNSIANDAETDAFNPAIEAADGEEADALQRGKIKNKVLKLTATMLRLLAQQEQGEDVTEKLAEEQTKLQNNIQQDEEAAGLPSTFLSFDATTD